MKASPASSSSKGIGGLNHFFVASTLLEGEEDLSYLYWVSTLEERPAECEVASSLACLNTWDKSRALVPTPVERPITTAPYRPQGV